MNRNEEQNILISVIVPVYNAEMCLRRCIDSIINQTYTNLEIILVDDGSMDASGHICDEFSKSDDRIIVVHKENGGQSSARNVGLDIANGDYIGFIDNDDVIHPTMYETLLRNARINEVDISGCATLMVYQDGQRVNRFENIKSGIKDGKDLILNILYQNELSWGTVWNKIFHKRIKNALYFPEGKQLEDYWVILRLFNETRRIYFEEKPMYEWYQHNSSQSKSGFNENKMTSIEIVHSLRKYFESCIEAEDIRIVQALNYFEFITRYSIINLMWKTRDISVRKRMPEQIEIMKQKIPTILKNNYKDVKIYKYIVKIVMWNILCNY